MKSCISLPNEKLFFNHSLLRKLHEKSSAIYVVDTSKLHERGLTTDGTDTYASHSCPRPKERVAVKIRDSKVVSVESLRCKHYDGSANVSVVKHQYIKHSVHTDVTRGGDGIQGR